MWRYKMVEFIIGASGTGKTTEMFRRIKEGADSGHEQCALVPEQYSQEFDKNLYNYVGAKVFNDIASHSFSSLARQLFQLYGDPEHSGEYAGEMARMILVYQAVSATAKRPESLRYFRRLSSQAGFAEDIMKLIGDMKRAGIESQELSIKSELLDNKLRDKTTDVAAIFYEYERLMEEYGFKDNFENIRSAAHVANTQRFFEGKYVFLDEFESFTGDQLEMLRVIFSSAENVVITLRSDDVSAGEFTLFETVNTTYRQLASLCRELHIDHKITVCRTSHRFSCPELRYLSENIMRNRKASAKAPKADNIRVFEARDMYSECEYICAEIKRLIASDPSLRYRDIAVISNTIEHYADILKAAFVRYEIPYFLSIERPVDHTAVMVFFIALLDLLTARKFRSEQVFRLLKCGLLKPGLEEVSLLENYCYKWGIDGDTWLEQFTAPDEMLDELEKLRAYIVDPIMKLRGSLRHSCTAEKACGLLYQYLVDCEAEQTLAALMGRLIRADRDYEAAELKRLWGCLMDILDSVTATLGDKEITFAELANIMRSMMNTITYSVPPQTVDSVIAASARTARLNSPRIIFAAGSCEGDFPNQVSLHGLFSESDKQKLSDIGFEIARPLSDLIASERLIVYKSLSTASQKLYLTYPLADLSGQAKYPSGVIDMIRKMFADNLLITERDLSPAHYAVTYHAAYYHYMQDRSDNTPEIASIGEVLRTNEVYRNRVTSVLSRSGERPVHTVPTEIVRRLKDFEPLHISPTALENYNNCHFMQFCSDFLKLQIPEKIELDVRISGDLTHNCFYRILGSRTKKDFMTLSHEQLSAEISAEAERYRAERLGGDFAKTPRFELLFNKLTERLAEVFVHTQESLMQSDFTPVRFEYRLKGDSALKLPFGNGYELHFGGIADRMDTCEVNGRKYLRVIDYKSSGKSIDENTLAGGLNLQMLLYLFSATEKGAVFGDCEPAGVLYTPIQIGEFDAEESRQNSFNQSLVDSKLRTQGLLIDDMDVVEAMEKDVCGRFIPAKLTAKGTFDSRSSVMPSDNMQKLRELVYNSLTEAAESMLAGEIEAVPLMRGKRKPCTYCGYADICGNPNGDICRVPDISKAEKAAEILGKKLKKGGKK